MKVFNLRVMLCTQVSAVCLTSYTASVLVMVGSTIATNQMSCIATSLMSASTTTSHSTYHLPSLTDFTCAPVPTTLTNQSVDLHTNLDLENLTLPQETVYARNPENHFVRNRNEWTEQKDWLTAISNIIASHPSTIIPVEIVSY